MNDYEKLKNLYEQIDVLKNSATSSTPEFITWHTKCHRFLEQMYGKDSDEVRNFAKTVFSLTVWTSFTTKQDSINACTEGLMRTKAIFDVYLEELSDKEMCSPQVDMIQSGISSNGNFTKIFVVHGHDGELKHAVARLIEKQGLEAIILSEQADRGATIIEKFEANSDVGAAVCLFSADDTGKSNKEDNYQNRARQNVVFEAGYFMGKLGRENVVLIADPTIELPSDLQGVVYTDKAYWEIEVLRNLKEIGIDIDMNKAFGK